MPASALSFRVTSAYRERLNQLRAALEAQARLAWPLISAADLDRGYEAWLSRTVPALAAGQSQALRLSGGYLTAFLTSELGEPTEAEPTDQEYVGVSRAGRALRDALAGPLITVKTDLGRGRSLPDALRAGQNRALRILGMELDHAARASLRDGLILDDRFDGYRRAVRGTCGACLGAAKGAFSVEVPMHIHPNCQCVSEPTVKGARDRFPRPTGEQLFAAMTAAEQDKAVGPEVAEAVRTGSVTLAQLVEVHEQERTEDFISQRPVSAPP